MGISPCNKKIEQRKRSHVDHRSTGHRCPCSRHGQSVHQGGEVSERFFVCPTGADVHDDDTLAAFGQQVTEQVSGACNR